MLTNYFKVSLRGLLKNPVNSFINIFGLAIAIGVCIFAYAFTRWTLDTDQFHENKNEVYLVTFFAKRDGTPQQYGLTPRPIGEMLRKDFPNIRRVCRVEDRNVIVKHDDNVFHEKIRFTDPEFLEMLTFPLKWGSAESLRDVNSIILSEKMSRKYFGDDNPVGRDMLVKFSETNGKAFKVAGVAREFPEAHTIEFNFLVNFENLRVAEPGYNFEDWQSFVNATLVQVENPADLAFLAKGMERYRLIQNAAVSDDWAITSFALEQLATLHRHSSAIRDDISMSTDGRYQSIVFISIIAMFMMALSCFNYINIAIVSAAKRLKEIGIRKTIGATRGVLIFQFLAENVLITFFALIAGLLLATFVFIPWIESVAQLNLGFTLDDRNLWIYLPAILLVTGIASGIYPAFYISRFQVSGILKGAVKFGRNNPLTKLFLGIQLVLACILVTTGVMFKQNTDYMTKQSWGYAQEGALYVSLPDGAAFEKLNALLDREAAVVSISGSTHHLGRSNARTVLRFPGHQFEVDELSVDARYHTTMGLELTEGRFFREHHESDRHTIVVNESFAATLGNAAVGQVLRIDSIQYEIIGVTKDFHSYSFFKKVNPTIFRLADKQAYRYLSVRVQPGTERDMSKVLQARWAELYPEIPFDGGFQEDVWGSYFIQLQTHARVWRAFGMLAVVLASLGLYGLVTLNVAGRVKEFSIRKILGAGLRSIAANISNQYLVLFAVALLLGSPVSYFLNKLLFDTIYWYHMPITYSGVAIAIAILVLVLILTVSTQIRKVLRENPVTGLKEE